MRALKDKNELLIDREEEAQRFKDENRRMLQEKAENEQMIQLLETQKSVLTKSSEDNLGKLSEVERLSEQIEKLRAENEQLRKNRFELEMIRDKLIHEKEDILANSESLYKASGSAELESKIDELRHANRQLRDMNETLSKKFEAIDQENVKLRQTATDGISKSDLEKLQDENTRLQSEYNNLKHEHGALDAKHQRFVINYGHDGDVAAREKQDLIKMRKERDATQKQVTLLQGQLSLMEGSKKRSEEQIANLTSEVAEARAQLKQQAHTPSKPFESDAASNREIERLKRELETAKDNQRVQDKMMKSLREESLEDVSTELQQMRGKLQELVGEIEQKDQTIENLEAELRAAKHETTQRTEESSQLREVISQMEKENESLRQEVQQIRDTLASELAEEKKEEEPELKRSRSAKSLHEELADAVKSKQNGTYGKHRSQSSFLSKSLSSLDRRPQSAPPDPDSTPDLKSATEGSHRLQSLISKYRSHGDKDDQASNTSDSSRGIKPLPGFVSSKIVSPKGRFGGAAGGGLGGSPKSSLRRKSGDASSLSAETPISPLAREDGVVTGTAGTTAATRPGGRKMLPPPPTPPKPSLSFLSSSAPSPLSFPPQQTNSTFMRSTSSPDQIDSATSALARLSASLTDTPDSQTNSATDSRDNSKFSSCQKEKNQSTIASLRANLQPNTTGSNSGPMVNRTLSSSSSGLGQSLPPSQGGSLSNTGGQDTGDGKEINALIQKNITDRFDEMASF